MGGGGCKGRARARLQVEEEHRLLAPEADVLERLRLPRQEAEHERADGGADDAVEPLGRPEVMQLVAADRAVVVHQQPQRHVPAHRMHTACTPHASQAEVRGED